MSLSCVKVAAVRIKHVLWRVGNGWIRTPDENPFLREGRENMFVFANLRQFADWAYHESIKEEKKPKK
jgi:hypothetical protein